MTTVATLVFLKESENRRMKILCLDQASHNSAYSILENGKLANYGVIEKNDKDSETRIYKMAKSIKELIIAESPRIVVFEDIQLQSGNVKSYRALARLQGMIIYLLNEIGINYKIVPPVTWKTALGINKRPKGVNARDWQKQACIEKMQKLYNVDLNGNDDIADAMGIMTYIHYTILENKSKNKES